MLIKYGANANSQNHNGQTPLFNAVLRGFLMVNTCVSAIKLNQSHQFSTDNPKLVKLLIRLGANVNHADTGNDTSLHVAVTWG